MSAYEKVLSDLGRLEPFGIRLGLANMTAACAELGNPEQAFRSVHISGTNGKGTTALCLARIATEHGLVTGCYTSPHLVEFRERIQVDGQSIEQEEVVDSWTTLKPIVRQRGMTYFEATTLLAFDHFARRGVDLAVVETGLGGRLDATNVISPELAIVTNVSFDHESHLGGSLSSIAREKAGIFKPGVRVVIGDPSPIEVGSTLRAVATRVGSELKASSATPTMIDEISLSSTKFRCMADAVVSRSLEIGAVGGHFAQDACLAVLAWTELALAPTDEARLLSAIASVALPGRGDLQDIEGVPVLFDVAHNPAAITRLCETVEASGRQSVFVLGFLSDKEWLPMLDRARRTAKEVWLCHLNTAEPDRRLHRSDAEQALRTRSDVRWAESVSAGFSAGIDQVRRGFAELVVISGSFRTVGEGLLAAGIGIEGEPYLGATSSGRVTPR